MVQDAEATKLPWSQIMAIGFGHLKLPPSEFWKMTLRELEAAVADQFSNAVSPINKNTFLELAEAYPDKMDNANT